MVERENHQSVFQQAWISDLYHVFTCLLVNFVASLRIIQVDKFIGNLGYLYHSVVKLQCQYGMNFNASVLSYHLEKVICNLQK